MRPSLSKTPVLESTLTALLALWVAGANAEDWPQFRGPNASGIAAESTHPPIQFSTTENVGWSVPLGAGVAGPIVAGGRVFVTSMSPEGQFIVAGYDAAA